MTTQTRAYTSGIAVGMACGWNMTSVGAVADELSASYGVGLATIGLFTTALFVVHMGMQIPTGRLADRFGGRSVCIAALVILIAANALASVAPSTVLGLGARALVGLGTGLGFIAGSDYIRSMGGSPFVQGIYGGSSLVAPGLALAVVPALEVQLGFRAPFVSAVAIAALVLVLMVLAPPSTSRGVRRQAGFGTGLLRDRRLQRFAAVHVGSFGLSLIVGNWVVTLLERHGQSHTRAALAGSLTLLLGFFTRAYGGWLLRSHPNRAPAAVATALLVGAAGTALLASPLPYALLVAAAATVGLAAGIPFAIAFSGAAAARPDAPGAAVGFVNAWAALAILVGTPLAGLAFSLPGEGRIGFLVIAVLWAVTALATPRRADLPGTAVSER